MLSVSLSFSSVILTNDVCVDSNSILSLLISYLIALFCCSVVYLSLFRLSFSFFNASILYCIMSLLKFIFYSIFSIIRYGSLSDLVCDFDYFPLTINWAYFSKLYFSIVTFSKSS